VKQVISHSLGLQAPKETNQAVDETNPNGNDTQAKRIFPLPLKPHSAPPFYKPEVRRSVHRLPYSSLHSPARSANIVVGTAIVLFLFLFLDSMMLIK
jgi:hypothetical protein